MTFFISQKKNIKKYCNKAIQSYSLTTGHNWYVEKINATRMTIFLIQIL